MNICQQKRNVHEDYKNHSISRKTFWMKVLQDIIVDWKIKDRQYTGEEQNVTYEDYSL